MYKHKDKTDTVIGKLSAIENHLSSITQCLSPLQEMSNLCMNIIKASTHITPTSNEEDNEDIDVKLIRSAEDPRSKDALANVGNHYR